MLDNFIFIVFSELVFEVMVVIIVLNQLVFCFNLIFDCEWLFIVDVVYELCILLVGLWLYFELLVKVYGMGVDLLIQCFDQMIISIFQLLQLVCVGQFFFVGSYQQVLLLDDVVKLLQDELEVMLVQCQQWLLLMDIENEVVVFGDVMLIGVILCNLVENVYCYSFEGLMICVLVKVGLMLVMVVEDEGLGIDEVKSGEFSKVFVCMDSCYGGIGFGLSIVMCIVQLYDVQFFLYN